MGNFSEKSKLVVQAAALLLLLCLGVIACLNLEVKADSAFSVGVQNTSFSIIQITDTQHLADMYPLLFDNLTKWIATNAVNFNVSMVVHTGDIVDYSSSSFDWQNANRSMSILLNSGVPYCWTAGNHDQNPQENPNASWLGSNYLAFNPEVMKAKPYWVSDLFNGKNTAVQFFYGNYKFLIIDIEYLANSTAISWMTNLIIAHPDYNVIVGTHCLLNNLGGYYNNRDDSLWETNFVNVLNNYQNVFLTLNGHDHDVNFAAHNQVGNRTQIFWDMQEVTNSKRAFVGAASARIYSFDMNSKIVAASTYLVYNSTWLSDSQNSFVFAPVLLRSEPEPTASATPTPEPPPPTSFPSLEPTPTVSATPTPEPPPPTSFPSLEPTPIDIPTPTRPQNPVSPQMPITTSSNNPSPKPTPTANSSLPTPAPLTPNPKPNSTSTTTTTTTNNAAIAKISFQFSRLSLEIINPHVSSVILLIAFAAVVIREKRK